MLFLYRMPLKQAALGSQIELVYKGMRRKYFDRAFIKAFSISCQKIIGLTVDRTLYLKSVLKVIRIVSGDRAL